MVAFLGLQGPPPFPYPVQQVETSWASPGDATQGRRMLCLSEKSKSHAPPTSMHASRPLSSHRGARGTGKVPSSLLCSLLPGAGSGEGHSGSQKLKVLLASTQGRTWSGSMSRKYKNRSDDAALGPARTAVVTLWVWLRGRGDRGTSGLPCAF